MTAIDLAGRCALVTGGASGIGLATAVMLRSRGADVVIGDIDVDGGRAVAADFGAQFHRLDVGKSGEWTDLLEAFGPFDIAFLNAGISTGAGLPLDHAPLAGLDDEVYRRVMSVNVDGVVFGTRAVLPGMIERGFGDIIVTASWAGLHPIAVDPIYGLSKHAVVGFVRSVAAWLASTEFDIAVNAVCPGFVDTRILGDEIRGAITLLGLDLMPAGDVADMVESILRERTQGAQWTLWPGHSPKVYKWNEGDKG